MHRSIKNYVFNLTLLLAGAATTTACSGAFEQESAPEQEPRTLGSSAEELVLLENHVTSSSVDEGGRNVALAGEFTLFTMEGQHSQKGALHLAKNGQPHRSYQLRETGSPAGGVHLGVRAVMTERWIAATTKYFPLAGGDFAPVVMVMEKQANGDFPDCGPAPAGALPNCIDSCDSNGCTAKPGVELLHLPPALAPLVGDATEVRIALDDSYLLIGHAESGTVAGLVYIRQGMARGWMDQGVLPRSAPEPGDGFGSAIAKDGTRVVVGAPNANGGRGKVVVYERDGFTSGWQEAFSYAPTGLASDAKFGAEVDISGDDIIVRAKDSVYFLELSSGLRTRLIAESQAQVSANKVAVDSERAIVSSSPPQTFIKSAQWQAFGGVAEGYFPQHRASSGNPGQSWGVDIEGGKAVVGWRGYWKQGSPALQTGAAYTLQFDDSSCGEAVQLPDGGTAQAIAIPAVAAVASSAEGGLVADNAVDGDPATRWAASSQSEQSITLDLGEQRLVHHLELEWSEQGYATGYTVRFAPSSAGPWLEESGTTFTGDGGSDWVDLTQVPEAFGRFVRLTVDQLATQEGASLSEMRVFGRVHSSCAAPTPVDSTELACGEYCEGFDGANSCWCDDYCVVAGDCCSSDGSQNGSEFASDVNALCRL